MTATSDSTEAAGNASGIAGWYGKLPCLGDFASRRLPPEFITPWDAWLQRSIATSRQQLGETWLEIFLMSPMWRFALAPGVCGEHAYAGLLLPSVDKVGRYFPLTLALPISAEHADVVALLGVQAWYAELEHIGLAALNVDYSPDALEAALAENPFPLPAPSAMPPGMSNMAECFRDPAPPAQSFHLGSIDDLAAAASTGARAVAIASAAGKSYWWAVAQESGATEFHYSADLPPDDYYNVLLGGSRVALTDAATLDPLQALDAAALR
jgi:type VI secretion system protein ImpM